MCLIGLEPTSVHLATYDHFDLAKAGADDGAVLSVVVDDLVVAGLDEPPRGGVPGIWNQGESLEFVACLVSRGALLAWKDFPYPRSS